jgi:hypothetical protein
VRAPPNAAVRRFTALGTVSAAIKIAALAILAVLVLHYLGGF